MNRPITSPADLRTRRRSRGSRRDPRPDGGRRRAARALLCGLVLLAGWGTGCGEPGSPTGEEPTDLAPDFTLTTLEGRTITLSELRGKTVVIDFWATWCPPCEFQVPELNAFYEAHGGAGDVEVLGVSIDTDGPDVVGEWTAEKGVRYPILLGDEALARRFGALGFPTLVIVAPDGSIDLRHVGLIERDALEEALQRHRDDGRAPSAT